MRQIVGEWVVIPVGGDAARSFLSINDAGALLWQILQHGANKQTLADALVDAYGVPHERAEADAAAFIARLIEGGIAQAI